MSDDARIEANGPSDKAVEASARVLARRFDSPADDEHRAKARGVLAAAHDPVLGLDRSVCLRDVLEALRGQDFSGWQPFDGYQPDDAADFIEREFGAATSGESEAS